MNGSFTQNFKTLFALKIQIKYLKNKKLAPPLRGIWQTKQLRALLEGTAILIFLVYIYFLNLLL